MRIEYVRATFGYMNYDAFLIDTEKLNYKLTLGSYNGSTCKTDNKLQS